MKIKRNNKTEYKQLLSILLFIIVASYLLFRVKLIFVIVSLVIIIIYFIVLLIKGFIVLNKLGIKLDNNDLEVNYLTQIDERDLKTRLFSPFIKDGKQYTIKTYNIKLKDIRKIGFTKDLSINFKNATKFDIGILDNDKRKYLIPMKQYSEQDIIDLVNKISKTVKLTGDINNLIK